MTYAPSRSNQGRLRTQVVSACENLLKEATKLARTNYGRSHLPTHVVISRIMVPSGPGRYGSKDLKFTELYPEQVLSQIEQPLKAGVAWKQATRRLQAYIRARRIKPVTFSTLIPDHHYAYPLIRQYFLEAGQFEYDGGKARSLVARMLKHLDSPAVQVRGIVVLEGLRAAEALRLEPGLTIRKITRAELLWLGRLDLWRVPRMTSEMIPHADWWICDVRLETERGGESAWNRIQMLPDLLALALRAFKAGGIKIGLLRTYYPDPFEKAAESWGSLLMPMAIRQTRYRLAKSDIRRFQQFWRTFRNLMEGPQHYLQLPVRCLRAGGGRRERGDAVVDYVVGLEALLGTEDERTELAYRLRTRGATVLEKRGPRRRQALTALRKLYDLRSRIVHGQPVDEVRLEQAIPQGEDALRRVWGWFFSKWRNRSDNRAGVEWIDRNLIG